MAKTFQEAFEKALAQKKKTHPRYSLRALARDTQISISMLSQLMTGKKTPSLETAEIIFEKLNVAFPERAQIFRTLLLKKIPSESRHLLAKEKRPAGGRSYRFGFAKDFSLLKEWYFIPLLDLSTCVNFKSDPEWIAKRLGVSVTRVKDALIQLEENGYLSKKNGKYQKTEQNLKFETADSQEKFTRFHIKMIEKALQNMQRKAAKKETEKRFVNSLTFACNPSKLLAMKEQLLGNLLEATDFLSDDGATEVYQLNLQLFPLTEPE